MTRVWFVFLSISYVRSGIGLTIAYFFFFQAEDGIRAGHVTGVQTCALPICLLVRSHRLTVRRAAAVDLHTAVGLVTHVQIGRASCRERVVSAVVGDYVKKVQ